MICTELIWRASGVNHLRLIRASCMIDIDTHVRISIETYERHLHTCVTPKLLMRDNQLYGIEDQRFRELEDLQGPQDIIRLTQSDSFDGHRHCLHR